MPIIAAVQGYDLNIGVGQAQAIDVAGDRVQFVSAIDPFAVIEVRPNFSQGNIVLKPGQGYRFAEQVTRWVVYNKGSVPLTGNLLIGTGDFFDQRISGTVDVIDGGKARTLGNTAFYAYNSVAVAAGQYCTLQLWNPVGSGKNLVVEGLIVTASAAVTSRIWWQTAALASASIYAPQAKLLGGAGSAGQLKTAIPTSSAFIAAQGLTNMSVAAGVQSPLDFTEPLILRPGYGLCVDSNVTAQQIGATFEYFEEIG
ncbi:hypothetical protein ACIP1U_31225 [Cupriavidus sp. NPDC089707]|uniref:hypothetical protein n=1 Tax=Cupriavidus sp. NPDC089707 TaxID=3363963 RepID=UPI00382AB33C